MISSLPVLYPFLSGSNQDTFQNYDNFNNLFSNNYNSFLGSDSPYSVSDPYGPVIDKQKTSFWQRPETRDALIAVARSFSRGSTGNVASDLSRAYNSAYAAFLERKNYEEHKKSQEEIQRNQEQRRDILEREKIKSIRVKEDRNFLEKRKKRLDEEAKKQREILAAEAAKAAEENQRKARLESLEEFRGLLGDKEIKALSNDVNEKDWPNRLDSAIRSRRDFNLRSRNSNIEHEQRSLEDAKNRILKFDNTAVVLNPNDGSIVNTHNFPNNQRDIDSGEFARLIQARIGFLATQPEYRGESVDTIRDLAVNQVTSEITDLYRNASPQLREQSSDSPYGDGDKLSDKNINMEGILDGVARRLIRDNPGVHKDRLALIMVSYRRELENIINSGTVKDLEIWMSNRFPE